MNFDSLNGRSEELRRGFVSLHSAMETLTGAQVLYNIRMYRF